MQVNQSYESNWLVFRPKNFQPKFFHVDKKQLPFFELGFDALYSNHYFYEQTRTPFATLNKQNEIVICNIAFSDFFNRVNQMIIGKTIYDLLPKDIYLDHFDTIECFITDIREKNSAGVIIFENEERYYWVESFLLQEGYVHIEIHDLSLNKQFEKLLTYQRQIESVSHMAASIAHELRNPLTVIKGFLQLSKLTNNHNVYYDTIMSELERMNGIIEDFLSVSRKQNERKLLEPHQLLDSIIEIIKPECILHNVVFDFEIERTTDMLKVNDGMMKQVFLNLMRNSIEAFKENEDEKEEWQFYIEGRKHETHYEMIVGDNGPGMTRNVIKNFGQPFITTKELGSGIGLPLCKKIIEEHGGTFDIDRDCKVGTRFHILLPFANEDE